VFGWRRRTIGFHTGKAQQLQGGRADAAGRSRHQRRLARPHFGYSVDHLPRGDIVQDRGRRLDIGDAIRNRNEVLGVADDVFGEAAVHRQRGNALPNPEIPHLGANSIDHAGDLVTRHERHWRRILVGAGQHHQIG